MSNTSLDIRQSQTRTLQDQLNSAATTQMDSTLASINNELTPPGRLIAASTPSLVVTIGSGTVVNPNTSKNRVLPFINNSPVSFAGGTITFPSTSGTITVSPGTNGSITIGASQFVAVLVQLSSSGQMTLVVGTAAGSLGAVVVPSGSSSLLSLGYIIVQSNGSSIIQNITNAMLYQFVGGGGSGGSGSGSGVGDDLDSLQFQASFRESFPESPSISTSSVNNSAGFTNATYSAANNMLTLSYDASKTFASGTNSSTVVLSANAAYIVIAGDVVVLPSGQVVKITTVNSQSNFTVETITTVPTVGQSAIVSQAVHTKDIYNLSVGENALSSAFTTSMSEFLVDYQENTGSGNIPNVDVAPVASFTVSADNSSWSSLQSRPTLESSQVSSVITPTSGTNCYLRFFANTTGSGTVNLLAYRAFMQKSVQFASSGGLANYAYAFLNGVGTPINCSLSTVANKTVVTLNFSYALGINSGGPYGSLDVYLNGQLIPRFINSTLTPDASYTETNTTVITLDQNYSAQNINIEVLQRQTVIAYTNTFSAGSITGVVASVNGGTGNNLGYQPMTIQKFTSGSGTYNLQYVFAITAGNATAGATYTNNGFTFTVYSTISAGTILVAAGTGAPTSSGTLTKSGGTGDSTITFSSFIKPIYLRVRLIGGGGGGGPGDSSTASGGNGGNTTFGTSLLTGNGGSGGIFDSSNGLGGSATLSAPAVGESFAGGPGSPGMRASASVEGSGGNGGASPFGGAGGGGAGHSTPGTSAATNSGSGGGGGGANTGGAGGGGGAGGYVNAIIYTPSATYAYSVGIAGTAGTGGNNGGAGGAGFIIVEEYYQ